MHPRNTAPEPTGPGFGRLLRRRTGIQPAHRWWLLARQMGSALSWVAAHALISPWLPVLALPLLAWGSYLTLEAQLEAAQIAGGVSHVHPPLWMLLVWGATALDGLVCYVLYQRWQTRSRRSTTRGSAHWATGRELAPYLAHRDEAALVLGRTGARTIALSERRQNEHVLLLGPTGKGKGVYVIVPGLLREPGTRSLFAIDPKSELVRLTAGAVAERHQVWVFAPDAPPASVAYNPLAHLHTFEDAQDFARCWVQNTGVAREPFWNDTAETLITGAAWHLRETEPDAPLSRLVDLLVSQRFDKLSDDLLGSPSAAAREVCAPVLADLQKNAQLQASVRTGLANRFLLLSSPNVQAVTESNTLDFVEMVHTPTALYLAIPSSASERLRPLSACLLMQQFATWTRLAEANGGQLPRQVMCYLDEFGNAGVIPHFAERIATLRSLGVALLIAIQSFAQLDKLYGRETAKIIRDNASTHLVLRGVGLEEARFYSQRIGETTIRRQQQGSGGFAQVQEFARPLITPDEIRTMPEGRMLVLADAAPPVRVRATPYYQDKRLAARANWPVPGLVAQPYVPPPLWPVSSDAAEGDAVTLPGWDVPGEEDAYV